MFSRSLLDEITRMRPEVSRGRESDQSEFTGERFLPGYTDGSIEFEHMHRYGFVIPYLVGKVVLDVACGEGYGCDVMAHVANRVTGVDIDERAIVLAQTRYNRPNLVFTQGSASSIPIEAGTIDVVVSFETLEHLEDQPAFWSEIKRVLKPGGVLFISSPNREAYNNIRSEKNSYHVRELSRQELTDELSSRFKNHELFSQTNVFGSLMMPVKGISRSHTVISIQPEIGVLNWKTGDEINEPYSVAIASDGPLPASGQSLYTGYYPPNALASLIGGIAERDRVIGEVKRELAAERALSAPALDRVGGVQTDADDREERAVLKMQREHALQVSRLKETLSEQDKVIHALKVLVGNYAQRAPTNRQTGSGYESVQESPSR